MNNYQEFIFKRTYSRYVDGRREDFTESVDRYINFFKERFYTFDKELNKARSYFLSLGVVPSMRAFWTAGKALEVNNIAGFNCAYTTLRDFKDFADMMYILMSGTGIGFSVERRYVDELPVIQERTGNKETFVVSDDKEGWANVVEFSLTNLFLGNDIIVDYSLIRPAGAKLKTMGGRASGAAPLRYLIETIKKIVDSRRGGRLRSIDVFDICCGIAGCVIVGGVRRSAMICLSDVDDPLMSQAKQGNFWAANPERVAANISVVYNEKPTSGQFLEVWLELVQSGTGERGIVNRAALRSKACRLGRADAEYGMNPCGEIILRPYSFCNLSEFIVRSTDTWKELKSKIRYATLFGVLQSRLNDFPYIKQEWRDNALDETLLGVSGSGWLDNAPLLRDPFFESELAQLRRTAQRWADKYSAMLGIRPPNAITTIKPSGTVSQLADCASGFHPRWSKYYIRNVRVDSKDPVAYLLKAYGVPWSPEVGQTIDNHTVCVFSFPIKSPDSSIIRDDVNALEQLKLHSQFSENFTDHNVSATIYVDDTEWVDAGAYVYHNFDTIAGISFLPKTNHVYQLAPYDEITKERYDELMLKMPEIDWSDLSFYEQEDTTKGNQEYACTAGGCEV